MGRVSGMEISSSQGLKKPPKISPREETLSSQGPLARGRLAFPSHGLILRFFFNPRDEEISIPETQGPFGNCIPVGVNQAKFLFHMKFLLHFDKF